MYGRLRWVCEYMCMKLIRFLDMDLSVKQYLAHKMWCLKTTWVNSLVVQCVTFSSESLQLLLVVFLWREQLVHSRRGLLLLKTTSLQRSNDTHRYPMLIRVCSLCGFALPRQDNTDYRVYLLIIITLSILYEVGKDIHLPERYTNCVPHCMI